MIKHHYNAEENIVYIERLGDITATDVSALIIKITSTFNSLDRLNVLENIVLSRTQFDQSDYPSLVSLIKKEAVNFERIRHAIVVENARDTALGMLFEKASQEIANYSFRTFGQLEPAKMWLMGKSPFSSYLPPTDSNYLRN